MRLAYEKQLAISEAIHQADADAMTYLFGSRADDAAKGGDIDLSVLSKKINLMTKLEILAQLHQRPGGYPRIGTVARESQFESDFLVI